MSIAKVRRLIGDRDASNYWLTDDEITEILSDNNSNVFAAASEAARTIAAELAQMEDIRISETSLSGAKSYEAMISLANELDKQAARANARPFAGGISVADKTTRNADTDRVKPVFSRELHANVGSE